MHFYYCEAKNKELVAKEAQESLILIGKSLPLNNKYNKFFWYINIVICKKKKNSNFFFWWSRGGGIGHVTLPCEFELFSMQVFPENPKILGLGRL